METPCSLNSIAIRLLSFDYEEQQKPRVPSDKGKKILTGNHSS